MMKKSNRFLHTVLALVMAFSSLPTMGLTVPQSSATVRMVFLPQTTTISPGEDFSVTVQVQAGAQYVDGAAAYINFDPAMLKVTGVTSGATLPFALQNSFDNARGTVDFATGTFSSYPNGGFTLLTIRFSPLAKFTSTRLELNSSVPRQTDATFRGVSVFAGGSAGIVQMQSTVSTATLHATVTSTPTAHAKATTTAPANTKTPNGPASAIPTLTLPALPKFSPTAPMRTTTPAPGVNETPPGTAILLKPKGSSGPLARPDFSWNKVPGATHYLLWVQGPAGVVIKQWYSTAQSRCNIVTCSLQSPVALKLGAYTWWLRAWNQAGLGPWSEPQSFMLKEYVIPGVVRLIYPSGSTVPASQITYAWKEDPEATYYQLRVESPSGNLVNRWYTTEQANCRGGICAMHYGVSQVKGAYSWRVRTWSPAGYGPWTLPATFTRQEK